ncbi:hypothetical protein RQP46_001799 [Phenoliferia psychrophenolica]
MHPIHKLALLLRLTLTLASFQAPLFAPVETDGSAADADAAAPLLSADFEEFAHSLIEEWHVPGMAIGVIKLGKEGEAPRVQFVNVGTAGQGRAVDPDAFTAASVGVLVDRGLFNWTTKVSSLIPDFALPGSIEGEASVLDIMSHRTGLPRHDHSYSPGVTHKGFIERIKHLRPSAEFREAWHQMFMTAAYLVSKLTSTPFTDFVTSAIFKPLNMTASTFSPDTSPTSWAHLSDSFMTLDNGTVSEIPYGFKESFEDLQVNAGAGGVVSSARDLMKWLEFLMTARNEAIHPGSSNASFPVSPQSILKMSSAHMPQTLRGEYPDVSATVYGLGLGFGSYQGFELIRHGGSIPGFGTQVVWSSERGVGAVALCNADGSGNSVSDIATYRAFDTLLRLKQVDWNSRYKEKARLAKELKTATLSATAAKVATLALSPPTLSLDKYLGAYTDPGYSNITVCTTPENAHLFHLAPECAVLHSLLDGALSLTELPPSSPRASFLIYRPGYFSQSHLWITQDEGDRFLGSWGYLFGPTSERKERTLAYAEIGEIGVEFVAESNGEVVGMDWSGVWGPGAIVVQREKEEGRRVEVAFTKAA